MTSTTLPRPAAAAAAVSNKTAKIETDTKDEKAESRNRQQQENWHRSRSDLTTHNHHHYHHHQTRTVDQLLSSIFAQFSALGGGGGGSGDQKELTLNFAKKHNSSKSATAVCLQKGTWPRKRVQVSGERERRTSGGGVLGNHTSAFLQSYTLAIIIIIIGRCVVNRGRRLFALDTLLDNQKRKRLPRHELLLLGNAEAEIERREPLGKHKLAIVKCAAAATGNKGKGQWKGKSHLLLVLISRRSQMTTTTTTTGAKWQCDA